MLLLHYIIIIHLSYNELYLQPEEETDATNPLTREISAWRNMQNICKNMLNNITNHGYYGKISGIKIYSCKEIVI